MAVSGITWHIEPNRPIATAAGSAVASDDEVNNRKNAAAGGQQDPGLGSVQGRAEDRGADEEARARAGQQESGVFGTAQSLDPQRDQDRAEGGVGGRVDDRNGKQRACDGRLVADGVERVGAAQQGSRADDGRGTGLCGWRVQHAAAALGEERDVKHQVVAESADEAAAPQQPEVPYSQGLEHDRRLSLSVPYIANLENGRGNPAITALTRLAEALGMRLVVTLVPGEEGEDGQQTSAAAPPEMPASLVRLGRTPRFGRQSGK